MDECTSGVRFAERGTHIELGVRGNGVRQRSFYLFCSHTV